MNWKDLLTDIYQTLIQSGDLSNNLISDSPNWLGFSGTSQAKIEITESRLNTILPPSYKDFLMTTNGFQQLNCFVENILPIEKIDWLRTFDKEFYELYLDLMDEFNAPDEKYFVYGESQQSTDFRSEYLVKTLVISEWGDSAILLLNPEVKFGDEWEAWMFATWQLGPVRYKSFQDLMQGEYTSYLRLINNRK